LGDSDEDFVSLREKMRTATDPETGERVYTTLTAVSLMVFFVLACQCLATLAVVRRETASWLWPAFMFVLMNSLAWVASFVVYQGGLLLGLG
ncbi:MAG: nucleoside recognition domain-containing protein, partial [Gemmatimonadota bacterium]|nr:nucleoside recognition domain-containing protein [Gemmatimonadota bacterium]